MKKNAINTTSVTYLIALFCLFVLPYGSSAQVIGVTSQAASTSFCAGTSVNVSYTVSGTFSNVPSVNVFSAQVSDANGSFGGGQVTIGTLTSTSGGVISCTIPSTLLTSNLYRFRVISNNPPVNGSDNGVNLTIFAIALNSPTIAQVSLCQGEEFSVTFSQSSCNFVNTPSANIYSVQMSNAAGSFTNPVVIGTLAATVPAAIPCELPNGTPTGSGYRFRIVASSPAAIGADNGSNITVLAAAGNPTVFGNNVWNVHCFETRNDYVNNYQGFYTQTSLDFNTTTRWANNVSPSSANNTGGAAYSGCPILSTNYSYSYKRTNIPCGYYEIDIPTHRNEVYLIINGVTVFQHTVCCDAHPDIWRGVILPSDQIEIRSSNLSSTIGYLSATFVKLNEITMSAPVTVCASTNATLVATNNGTLGVTYAWTPSVSVSPTTGSVVIATPASTTNYTVTASANGCPVFTNAVLVTVNPVPTTAIAISTNVICNGFAVSTMTATGANTYVWSPAVSLNTSTGNIVVASPTITTTYTVIGSNNCTTVAATRVVTVQNVPTAPSPTVFGNNVWNVYCYNSSTYANLFGYYTENNLSFTTTARWAANSAPSTANGSSGIAYQGCNLTNASHGTIWKRTNFTCGYYQINVNSHNDNVTIFVDGNQEFQHIGTGDSHPAAWTGFLGAGSEVEIRHANTTGNTSSMAIAIFTVVAPALSPNVIICLGSSATLTAGYLSGVNYSWSPSTYLNATTGTVVIATPPGNTNYTCVITDTNTGCTAGSTTSVTVSSLPNLAVSPVSSTINCPAQIYTLTATGANTYTWNPSVGLSSANGHTVVATPSVTTVYTVTGNNNCSTATVVSTVSVVPLANPTVFPNGTWNCYCYNSVTYTNYYGYYTEDGSGTSGYDFNTTTRWASGAAPSNANNVNGQPYLGCTMPTTNWSMIFKRTGFSCNTYTITANQNLDAMVILINGVQVAARNGSSVVAPLWIGPLTPSSTVEFRLIQNTGTSGLNVSFTPMAATPSLSIWAGATSNNWFTATNWCGSGVPTASDDVLIYNTGTPFQPLISGAAAACANLTISPAKAAVSGSTSAITAAALTMSGAASLNVYGDFINQGNFTPGTGTVSILGTGNKIISSGNTLNFNTLILNNSGPIVLSAALCRINSNLNFTNGVITHTNELHFLNNATATNADVNSYVDGQVRKYGNQAFTFPLGFNGFYRPIGISAPVSNTDHFTADYNYLDPSPSYTHTSKDASIDHISRCEYWMLNRTGGSSNVTVTISWDASSCGIDNIADLVVSRWDAGQVRWKDHGNSSTTGNTSAGTVVSNGAISVFSPFTLGSRTALNALPIQLVSFDATCNNKQVHLNWSTNSEIRNDYFIVDYTLDGKNWTELNRINSKGSGSILRHYTIIDELPGNKYYRLTQVDKDGRKETFKTIVSNCDNTAQDITIFPNPSQAAFTLQFQSAIDETVALTVFDNLGRKLAGKEITVKKGFNSVPLELDLTPGVYSILVKQHSQNLKIQKLVIQ